MIPYPPFPLDSTSLASSWNSHSTSPLSTSSPPSEKKTPSKSREHTSRAGLCVYGLKHWRQIHPSPEMRTRKRRR